MAFTFPRNPPVKAVSAYGQGPASAPGMSLSAWAAGNSALFLRIILAKGHKINIFGIQKSPMFSYSSQAVIGGNEDQKEACYFSDAP